MLGFKVIDDFPAPVTIQEAETALEAGRLYVRVPFVSPRAPKSKPVFAFRLATEADTYGRDLSDFRVQA